MNCNVPLSILVADPYPICNDGIAAVLSRQPDMRVVGQAECGQEAIDLFGEHEPDALVMERFFPDMDGCTVITTLCENFPAARTLVYSLREEEEIIRTALQAGAKGYLFKDSASAELVQAVRTLCSGEMALGHGVAVKLAERVSTPELSRKERVVLQHIVNGRSNQEIGEALFVSEGTVKSHVNSILAKLGARDRTHAAVVALKRGLATLP